MTSEARLVRTRTGAVVRSEVFERVLRIEARGATFRSIPGGRFRVSPRDVLTDADRAFLHEFKAEALEVVRHFESVTRAPA